VSGGVLDLAGLYRHHSQEVFRFALQLCGDRATAEDITSETFVRLWGAGARPEIRSMRAYLLAIARNLYLRGRRRAGREDDLEGAMRDPALPADEKRVVQDELERTLRALQSLPEIDRTALLLRAEEELPYEEIAAVLGITPVAARVKIHRARAKLALLLKEPES
jgi:RNA polymerase sigma-70 factor, ECF subfamily